MKEDLKEYLTDDVKNGMAESHLSVWWERYQGKTKEEVKFDLRVNHDDSLEVEYTESELKRELTDEEKTLIGTTLVEAIIDNIEFTNDVAVGWYDTCGDFNLNKWY
jgi:hypothetical protein